jgi:hypothetical protein
LLPVLSLAFLLFTDILLITITGGRILLVSLCWQH